MSPRWESIVEDVALAWLESLGYAIKHGPEIAPGEFSLSGPHLLQTMQQLDCVEYAENAYAVSKKATVSKREIVLRLRSTRMNCENGLATTEDTAVVKY